MKWLTIIWKPYKPTWGPKELGHRSILFTIRLIISSETGALSNLRISQYKKGNILQLCLSSMISSKVLLIIVGSNKKWGANPILEIATIFVLPFCGCVRLPNSIRNEDYVMCNVYDYSKNILWPEFWKKGSERVRSVSSLIRLEMHVCIPLQCMWCFS